MKENHEDIQHKDKGNSARPVGTSGERIMKVYILVDMEGASGIWKMEMVKKEFPSDYVEGKAFLEGDINAAVAAAFEAGASEVVVCDSHSGGGNVNMRNLNPKAVYETSNVGHIMPSLDKTFSGIILLSHHAMAGTLNGFLDHTWNSMEWFEFKINGKPTGEIGIEAAYAAHFNVPVIAVTGDEAACREARDTLGAVERAIVKWGIGRNRAKCLPPDAAHEEIRQAVLRGVRSIPRRKPFKPRLPMTLEKTYYRSDMADKDAATTGARRVDARTVRKVVNSHKNIFWWA